ncbi:Hint domain-containing protein [Rhodobacter sp. JA431]|uniref:Hint domain-containing protein n=1 Tax=Rhodobacter sp. JA431 TaxID=570013 RepID=UPI000BCFF4E4|nr:Hint domain-containing protein [Rhodobacter sp. JA431]SOC09942.1 Hint domain-containing protein [Rhodobacter sp. JA431]
MEYGYPVSVLNFDAERKLWSLAYDFDAATMMWTVLHTEEGAQLHDALGATVMQGTMTADVPLILEKPEGGTLRLDRIEIDGVLCLFMPSDHLTPGTEYPEAEPFALPARAASPEEIAVIPSLGTGAMIATAEGPTPIDWLRPGDRVLTRDNGYQSLLWVGVHTMPRRAPEETRPLVLAANCFGEALPERDVLLSPGTGVLLAGHELELWFGESEMFAKAKHALPKAEAGPGRQQLYSMLFPTPEVVLADGMWVSTVHADAPYLSLLPDRMRGALSARVVAGHKDAARAWLEDWEVAMFRRERIARARRLAA